MAASGLGVLAACKGTPPIGPADASRAPSPLPPSLPSQRAWLDESGWALIAAITERILPSDDGAGAREANVVRYIDGQLATPKLKPLADAVKQFLDAMGRWEKKHGARFAALDLAAQDQAIAQLAIGKLDVDFDAQADVFAFVHSLTLEGFLSDPAHGGNADGVGWAYIGWAPVGVHHDHGAK
jgi:gluconate 2-dehydrogenase gamma chain